MSHASEFDAHGHKDHGHFIVPLFTLRAVLAALLFFTLLTVGAATAEQWIAHTFNVEIPQWVNVFVALSIAVVKTFLVVSFFMQLKYDNPMNTTVFVFTILTVAFFLGFTSLDLNSRSTLDRYKAMYVQDGGTGISQGVNGRFAGKPITEAARLAAIADGTYDPTHAHHASHGVRLSVANAGYVPETPATGSSASRSRPLVGLTEPFAPRKTGAASAPAKGGHSEGSHGGH